MIVLVRPTPITLTATNASGSDNKSLLLTISAAPQGPYGWGLNCAGQVGDGTFVSRTSPVPIATLSNVTAMAGGGNHSLALECDGSVWTWGLNTSGQLGDGTVTQHALPAKITNQPNVGGTGLAFANVPEAANFVLIYQLPIPNNAGFNGSSVPYTIDNSLSVTYPFDRIAYYMELDTGSGLKYVYVSMNAFTTNATKIGVPNTGSGEFYQQNVANMNVVSNFAGITTGTAISTGNLEFWPSNYGQSNDAGVPNANAGTFDFGDGGANTSAGYGSMQIHNYGASQTLMAYNNWGGTGNGDLGFGNQPSGNPDWTFANNAPSYTIKNLQVLIHPTSIPAATFINMVAVSAGPGGAFSLSLRSDGTVWAWGDNSFGQLGDGSTTNRSKPVQVTGLTNILAISAGATFSVALASDGTVWTWGDNRYGQLDDGTLVQRNTPFHTSLTGITAIASGGFHFLALKSNGTVFATGNNTLGQLGDNTKVNRSAAVQVSGLSGVSGISAGSFQSLAVKSDGSAWDWGDNTYGQLGNGTTSQSNLPVPIGSLSTVKSVAGGGQHGLALLTDGTVWAWGRNLNGQLGDGTNIDRSLPVKVTLTTMSAIAAGTAHSLAVVPLQAPVINSPTSASGIVSTSFNYQITATNTPTAYNATGLPAGLSIATGTGLISGTPTAIGVTTATITATNASGTCSATVKISVTGAPNVITLTATPSSITANGTSQSTITATVKDSVANGSNPVPNQTVTFTTNLGTVTASAVTNSVGVAVVNLTSGTIAGTATVTAVDGAATNTVSVVFTSGSVANTVTLTPSPATILADGISTSTVTALVKDIGNNPVAGQTVTFSTTKGIVSTPSTTNASGIATATVTSGISAGTATVTAVAGTKSGFTTITFVAGPAAIVTVTASPGSIVANGSSTSTITVKVSDNNNNPISGIVISPFTRSLGTLSAIAPTNSSGISTATLTSGLTGGPSTITATVQGTSISGNTVVTFTGGSASAVSVAASPTNLWANGTDVSTISATFVDQNSNPVVGQTVNFTTTSGTFPGPSTSGTGVTNTSGVATIQLTSSITVTSNVTVTASVGAINNNVLVNFVAGPVATVTVTPNPGNLTANGTSTLAMSAAVKDAQGRFVLNQTVAFSTTLGGITPPSSTGGTGTAAATLTASNSAGQATITATAVASSKSGTGVVNMNAGSAAIANATPAPSTIAADNSSTSVITIVVTDSFGNPVSGQAVSCVTDLGTITVAPANTNASGTTSATLKSSLTLGTAHLTITAGAAGTTASVAFTSGVPNTVVVVATPNKIVGNGVTQSLITATVTDAQGHPLQGKTVTFSTTLGSIQPSSTTNASGVASVNLTSSVTVGVATVTATCSGKTGNATVTFTPQPARDFNADLKSDILFRNSSTGVDSMWLMNGVATSQIADPGLVADTSWSIVGTGDFDGNGKADILWYNQVNFQVVIWFMNGPTLVSVGTPGFAPSTDWKVACVGDLNGDGKADIVFRNMVTGDNMVWFMNGGTIASSSALPTVSDLNYKLLAAGDFDGDGKADLLWYYATTGQTVVWTMNGASVLNVGTVSTVSDLNWQIVGIGDFNGDGKVDLLWRHNTAGSVVVWLMNGSTLVTASQVGTVASTMKTVTVGDYNGDGFADILFQDSTNGNVIVWLLDGNFNVIQTGTAGNYADPNMKIIK